MYIFTHLKLYLTATNAIVLTSFKMRTEWLNCSAVINFIEVFWNITLLEMHVFRDMVHDMPFFPNIIFMNMP